MDLHPQRQTTGQRVGLGIVEDEVQGPITGDAGMITVRRIVVPVAIVVDERGQVHRLSDGDIAHGRPVQEHGGDRVSSRIEDRLITIRVVQAIEVGAMGEDVRPIHHPHLVVVLGLQRGDPRQTVKRTRPVVPVHDAFEPGSCHMELVVRGEPPHPQAGGVQGVYPLSGRHLEPGIAQAQVGPDQAVGIEAGLDVIDVQLGVSLCSELSGKSDGTGRDQEYPFEHSFHGW